MLLRIPPEELTERQHRVRDEMRDKDLDCFVVFSSLDIFYLTGFAFIPTERPIALVLTPEATVLFLPRLEVEHAQRVATVDQVVSYPEYPGRKHPMQLLAERIKALGCRRPGADADGYGSPYGYQGPRLSEVLGLEVKVDRQLIAGMRMVKSPNELALIKESARWGHLAHVLLQQYSRAGVTELEVSLTASREATLIMTKVLGPDYRPGPGRAGASAGFRGQIGKESALPHAVTTNAALRPGDVLVTGAGASVWGYGSELERTMFVGEPDAERRKYFQLMCQAQEIAFENIKPGRRCADVDLAVEEFFDRQGLRELWRHHTGHALGLAGHEAPFFDVGDDTEIRPGMVFSVEPGLYVPDLGGFRHSDTVVVTEDGIEIITYYPRDWQSLVV